MMNVYREKGGREGRGRRKGEKTEPGKEKELLKAENAG